MVISAPKETLITRFTPLFESTQNIFVLGGIVCLKCRSQKNGDLFAFCKVVKEALGIVIVFPCSVLTGVKAGATGDTTVGIDVDAGCTIGVRLCGYTGTHTAAD